MVTLHIDAWDDPAVTMHGWHPEGPGGDEAWAGIVGPTAVLMHRVLWRRIDTEITDGEIAALTGCTPSKIGSVLRRLERFGLIRTCGFHIQVRTALPPLTVSQRRRLPEAHPAHLEQTA